MQAEIENVIRAYKREVGREEKLLIAFMSALAVGSAARKRMTTDMAAAVNADSQNSSEVSPRYASPESYAERQRRSI